MSIHDPIADMLTCIRNAQRIKKKFVLVSFSKFKEKILFLLKKEGYISNYSILKQSKKKLQIELKYFNNQPVIEYIQKVSRPSLRVYYGFKKIPMVINGLGISVISTSFGLMTDHKARKKKIGGEIIFSIY